MVICGSPSWFMHLPIGMGLGDVRSNKRSRKNLCAIEETSELTLLRTLEIKIPLRTYRLHAACRHFINIFCYYFLLIIINRMSTITKIKHSNRW